MTTPDPGSWRLAPNYAVDTQGLIVSPFSHHSEALALLLDISATPGGAWLRALRDPRQGGVAITPATGIELGADGLPAGCAAIAFTSSGLRVLGLSEDALSTFADPFAEGMHTVNRRRRLSDDKLELRPRHPLWGGNAPLLVQSDQAPIKALVTVHAALLLYHASREKLDAFAAPLRKLLAASGVKIAHELALSLRMDDSVSPPISREHFGFADGISQPVPFGNAIVDKTGLAYPKDPVHGVASGDILLGHINAHQEPAPAPLLPVDTPGAAMLPTLPDDATQRSLGLNGSYLVIRELSQDVDAFWSSMQKAAQEVGAASADWVAERVVGRTKDGVVLAETPPQPTADGPGNDFLFWDSDSDGRYCPLGSHIRRANPRDGLAPSATTRDTILTAANNHRLLRRGRKYMQYQLPVDYAPEAPSLPGLLFMCLNTDLERQFEFVQQTWMMNPSFAALFNENDPLLGPVGDFTIPSDPLRLKPTIDTFIRLVGGEYFFLPSLPAIEYFSTLPARGQSS